MLCFLLGHKLSFGLCNEVVQVIFINGAAKTKQRITNSITLQNSTFKGYMAQRQKRKYRKTGKFLINTHFKTTALIQTMN